MKSEHNVPFLLKLNQNFRQFWSGGTESKGNDIKTIALIFSIHKKQKKTDTNGFGASSAKRKRKIGDFTVSVLYRATRKELDCILKRRQKELLLKKSEVHRIRARIPHFEENDSNISYNERMEKSLKEILFNLCMSKMVYNNVKHHKYLR